MKQTESRIIKETVVTGRKFRQLDNSETKNWDRICLTPFITDRPFKKAIPINISKS